MIIRYLPFWVLPALGTAFVLWTNSTYGMGITDDSMRYLSMAKHIAAGKGVMSYNANVTPYHSYPEAHFPPFYPLLIVPMMLTGTDLKLGTWCLNGALYFVNALLVMAMVHRCLEGRKAATTVAAFFILTETHWCSAHSLVLTEPLFMLLTNAALCLLWRYLRTPDRAPLLWAAALIGVSAVTRWIGAAYVLSGLLMVMVMGRPDVRKRMMDAALFVSIAVLPISLWVVRNMRVLHRDNPDTPLAGLLFADLIRHDTAERAPFVFYWVDLHEKLVAWSSGYIPALSAINPAGLSWVSAAAIGMFALALWINKDRIVAHPSLLALGMLGITTIAYGIVLVQSLVSSGLNLPDVDSRYLYLVFMYLLVGAAILSTGVARRVALIKTPLIRRVLLGVLLALLAFTAMHAARRIHAWSEQTRLLNIDGHKDARWNLVQRVSLLPPARPS